LTPAAMALITNPADGSHCLREDDGKESSFPLNAVTPAKPALDLIGGQESIPAYFAAGA
jgi:hypothetical protein